MNCGAVGPSTSNIQHPTTNIQCPQQHPPLDVGSWMLDVRCFSLLSFFILILALGERRTSIRPSGSRAVSAEWHLEHFEPGYRPMDHESLHDAGCWIGPNGRSPVRCPRSVEGPDPRFRIDRGAWCCAGHLVRQANCREQLRLGAHELSGLEEQSVDLLAVPPSVCGWSSAQRPSVPGARRV
jgi:hypothetical protein